MKRTNFTNHWWYRRCPRIVALIVAIPFIQACRDEAPQAPVVVASPHSIEIKAPRDSVTMDASAALLLRWEAVGPATDIVKIHYRAIGDTRWTFLRDVSRPLAHAEIPLNAFLRSSYRFAVSTNGDSLWDSSGVVTITRQPFRLLEPLYGTVFLVDDSIRFRWSPAYAAMGVVEIQYSPSLSERWTTQRTVPAADGEFLWVNPPFASTNCVDFRIRVIPSSEWQYARKIGFGEITINAPKAGDVLHRFLKPSLDVTVRTPSCTEPQAFSRYEVTTDGGTNWHDVPLNWAVEQTATTRGYLRVSNDDLGASRTMGPFTIVDRSSTFFEIHIGQQLRYFVFGFDSRPEKTDTTSRQWLLVTVLASHVRTGRTEYTCSLLYENQDGTSEVKTGLLWRNHEDQQMVGGDFEPFKNAAIPGLHDESITSFDTDILHTPPGQLPALRTWYKTVRGKGITDKYHTQVVGRVPPRGLGVRYQLLN